MNNTPALRAAEKIYRDEANCYEGRINQRAKAGDPIAQRVLDDAVQIITSEFAPMVEALEDARKGFERIRALHKAMPDETEEDNIAERCLNKIKSIQLLKETK